MKKSILFIIISIFTAVTFLSTAAVCNLCSGLSTIADNIENSQLLQSQASSPDTASGETPEEDSSGQEDNTQQNQDQQQDEHHEKPEISIFYDEEPVYSEQDDTWQYIIVSEVYGNPFPKVTWNRDDSNGEHGEYAVQINLERGEAFKVIATAENYLGANTSEIPLKYGTPVQQQIEPPDDGSGGDENQEDILEIVEFEVPIIIDESGTLRDAVFTSGKDLIFVGDDYENINSIGFISFDISSFDNITITEANLNLSFNSSSNLFNNTAFTGLHLGVYDWGAGNPIDSNLLEPAVVIKTFNMNELTFSGSRDATTIKLKEEIQKAINNHKSRFRVMIYFSGALTDNNGEYDNITLFLKRSDLSIKYTIVQE